MLNRIFLSAPDMSGRERKLVEEAFDTNFIAPAGPMLDRFESDICEYTGISSAVAVSSGTAALHLALLILGVQRGDTVWTSSMTFIGGVSPITMLGAQPVFFDLRDEDWSIDCDAMEECLSQAAKKSSLPAAIVPTDLYGQSCDLQRLVAIANRFDVPVVCDSAEALGSYRNGYHSGKGAHASILSFNGNKIITTSGGGMLLSDDRSIVEKARYLATQAREPYPYYEHLEIGFNYRLSNVCAAIGVGQLEMIEQKVARRREIYEKYVAALASIEGVKFMPEPDSCRSTRWLTCLTIDSVCTKINRNSVLDACAHCDIEVRPLWKPMHMQPVFKGSTFVGSGLCVDLFNTGLCLPSGSGMSAQEQDRVIDCLVECLTKGS